MVLPARAAVPVEVLAELVTVHVQGELHRALQPPDPIVWRDEQDSRRLSAAARAELMAAQEVNDANNAIAQVLG